MIPKQRLTKNQTLLWNEMFLYGERELMTQRQRRTAFTLQLKVGMENIEIYSPESNDSLEFIRFKKIFADAIGAVKIKTQKNNDTNSTESV